VANGKRRKEEEHVRQVLRTLNHEVRQSIMRLALGREEALISPTEASRSLGVPLSNISYHFRVLEKNRALDMTKERPARGSIKHFYRANPAVAKMPVVAAILAATSAD
jgi:DNA-binding transcriptional ArsR family regulator